MTLQEFDIKFKRAKAKLADAEIAKAAEIAGLDLAALIVDRVVQTGKDSKGALFSSYSTRPMNPKKLKGKSRRGSAETKVAAYIAQNKLLSYSDFRVLNGLKVDKKNFEFTGEMWRKFTVVNTFVRSGVISLTLDGSNPAAKKKLAENTKREGQNIAEPSNAEKDIVKKELEDWINNILKL